MTQATTIAVIGGGMTGTILTARLLGPRIPRLRVCLFDRDARFGQGLAYATRHDGHLLNVPAGRMSAFHDRDTHFLDWLRAHVAVLPDGTAPAAAASYRATSMAHTARPCWRRPPKAAHWTAGGRKSWPSPGMAAGRG